MIKGLDLIVDLQKEIEFFRAMPELNNRAARLAINRTINRDALTLARDEIMDQLSFPADYLRGDRLRVSKLASENDLEGIIVARKRATSLARFAQGQPIGQPNRATGQPSAVGVKVKRGQTTVIRNAWLVRLNRGASKDEDNYNVGLAVRVKPGDKVRAKRTLHTSWLVKPDGGRAGIALLYGPSVDQVFRDVSDDISPEVGDRLAAEFLRQLTRLIE